MWTTFRVRVFPIFVNIKSLQADLTLSEPHRLLQLRRRGENELSDHGVPPAMEAPEIEPELLEAVY